jgi:glutamine amidotransferase
MVHPILDEYYNRDPAYTRSSQYVTEKGLTTNDKTCASRTSSPIPSSTPSSPQEIKKLPASKLSDCFNNRVSELHPSVTMKAVLRPGSPSRNLTPDLYNSESSIRSLSSFTTLVSRDPSRPQEQGNTKKKRVSLMDVDAAGALEDLEPHGTASQRLRPSSASQSPNERANSFGSPAKITQYFPELS